MLHRAIQIQFLLMMTEMGFVNSRVRVRTRAHEGSSMACKANGDSMAKILKHRKVNIVVLEEGETIGEHCGPGDIAITPDARGWWTRFVGARGAVESYDEPYASYNEAMWAAKAAAEFGID